MVEKYFFKGKLLKNYDYTLFSVKSTGINTWDVVFTLPKFSVELQNEMINSPWETTSDTFYFIDERLILHFKAQ